MKVQLLDPTNGYKPFTSRTKARDYLESPAGEKEVAVRISPTNKRTLNTEVVNDDALIGECLGVNQIGISTPADEGEAWLAVNEY